MDGFNYIEDHFETTVKPRILEQYKESGRWQACLAAVVRKLQAVEDTAFSISKAIDFKTETPTGAKLDWVAGLINVKRFSGESDQAFFLRFESMCGANAAGTPDNVIYNAAILSGDPSPQYMDEAPATFFVYTPDGLQIPRRRIQKLAPAGVLALPGAWLKTVDGGIGITTVTKYSGLEIDGNGHGKRILAAAIDVESMGLVAETGELILTENGERIVTEGT